MTIKTGEKMYASDILNLTFFPKGTILTFSTEAWNNATNPGFKDIWKICDGQNGTPNLVNMFLRGAGSSGTIGGADSVALTANNLPSHNHGATGLSVGGLSTSGLSVSGQSISGLIIGNAGSHSHNLYDGSAALAGGHTHTYDTKKSSRFMAPETMLAVAGLGRVVLTHLPLARILILLQELYPRPARTRILLAVGLFPVALSPATSPVALFPARQQMPAQAKHLLSCRSITQ
jgi:hypothetical protein